jgi:dTDP-4-dehydrorhamnose 3,5-epimerase
MIVIKQTKLAFTASFAFTHSDERGTTYQTMNNDEWLDACRRYWVAHDDARSESFPFRWHHENVVVERMNTLRGLHTDFKTWKLACCLVGVIRLGLLDTRSMETEVIELWPDAPQVLIPPWVANGHAVLSDTAVFHYLWNRAYETHARYKWDKYDIDWGVSRPVVSREDS